MRSVDSIHRCRESGTCAEKVGPTRQQFRPSVFQRRMQEISNRHIAERRHQVKAMAPSSVVTGTALKYSLFGGVAKSLVLTTTLQCPAASAHRKQPCSLQCSSHLEHVETTPVSKFSRLGSRLCTLHSDKSHDQASSPIKALGSPSTYSVNPSRLSIALDCPRPSAYLIDLILSGQAQPTQTPNSYTVC